MRKISSLLCHKTGVSEIFATEVASSYKLWHDQNELVLSNCWQVFVCCSYYRATGKVYCGTIKAEMQHYLHVL